MKGSLFSALHRVSQRGGRSLASPCCSLWGQNNRFNVQITNTRCASRAIINNSDEQMGVSRHFSSMPERKSMLRLHAVTLKHSDYEDDLDEARWDIPEEETQLDPTDQRKMEEEEEATWWLYDGTQESRDVLAAMRAEKAEKDRWIKMLVHPYEYQKLTNGVGRMDVDRVSRLRLVYGFNPGKGK